MKQTIGDFLIRRLEEAGINHIFGVPGDYNLEFMQQIEDRGAPAWIGTCNELNGSYAADGYARINGLSAVVVTNGVGALSAINGVAGAFSEHVPVICIAGTLPAKSLERSYLMHHTLADGGRGNFYRAFCEVTAAQALLTPQNAAGEIDRLILTCWRRKLPVYMELASDISYLEIDVPEAPLQLTTTTSDPERLRSCLDAILTKLRTASAPAMLLDLDANRFGIHEKIAALAEKWQMAVATLSTSKSAFSEASPLYAGTYVGQGGTPACRAAVEKSDCLIAVGYRRVESTTGFLSDHLPAGTVYANPFSTDIDAENFQAVELPELLQGLIDAAPASAPKRIAKQMPAPSNGDTASGTLTQKAYWRALQAFLKSGDILIAEDGTSIAGAGSLTLPAGCTYIAQAVWGTIGYATASLLGVALAAPDRRVLLFTGEGSFQLTAQEISTVLRHGLKPFVFLINNHGYTIERTILGKDAKYNDVANWYLRAASACVLPRYQSGDVRC